MRSSWLYAHPRIYDAALNVLYRGKARRRFDPLVARIPAGASVLDLCAGSGALYDALAPRGVRYRAFEINPVLVDHLRRRGIDARCCDVRSEELPEADVVTMCLSLYHFFPDCRAVLERMIASARREVIVLEPVRNASQSCHRLLRWVGRSANRVNGRTLEFFFDEHSFSELARSVPGLRALNPVGSGRDIVAVFAGRAESRG
jgi:SAM-dependent methyltransferase